MAFLGAIQTGGTAICVALGVIEVSEVDPTQAGRCINNRQLGLCAGLIIGLHAGDDIRRVTSWFDVEVPALDFVLHEPAAVVAAVKAAGLTDIEWYLRGPHEWRGETTQRLYVLARRA